MEQEQKQTMIPFPIEKQKEWFSVEGDLDDFIFYEEEIIGESER